MQLPLRARYALRAMIDLAAHHNEPPVKRQDIAQRQSIPESYLVQLFVTLRNAGLVQTTRGPAGGHKLSMSPAKITVGDIVGAFEADHPPTTEMNLPADRPIDEIWGRVESSRLEILNGSSLDDLLQDYLRGPMNQMFHI